jgi:hypothetical protein
MPEHLSPVTDYYRKLRLTNYLQNIVVKSDYWPRKRVIDTTTAPR